MDKNYLESCVTWYSERTFIYESLSRKVSEILQEIFSDSKINYHTIEWRVKSVESFRGKLTKGIDYDPKQMKDLAGIRVIVYVHSDLDDVRKIISSTFDIKESKNKSKSLEIDRFGYRSEHFIAVLPKDRIKLAEYKKYEGLLFEIQIRTILEHSWAEIEHDRNYKFSGVLPQDMKRRFALLSASLELADNEFDSISKSIDALKEEVSSKTKAGEIDIPINSISLRQYLTDKFGSINKLRPNFGEDKDYSEILINELNDMGIKTLKDLEAIIPSDYVEKYNESINEIDSDNNFLSLVRDFLIIKYNELYFEKAWKESWYSIEDSAVNLLRKYITNIDELIERYNLYIMPIGCPPV